MIKCCNTEYIDLMKTNKKQRRSIWIRGANVGGSEIRIWKQKNQLEREREEKDNRKCYLESSKLSKAIRRIYELVTSEAAKDRIYRTQNSKEDKTHKSDRRDVREQWDMRPTGKGKRPHAPVRSLYKGIIALTLSQYFFSESI